MTALNLAEWSRVGGVELDPDQIRALAAGDALTVSPDPEMVGRWIVGATRFVGVVQLGDLEIRVQPKVGVRRLVELLTESQDRIRWDSDAQPDLVESPDLLGVIAEAFAERTSTLLHHGLLQGYRQREEALPAVRGRVLMATQMGRRVSLPLPVELSIDEFTFDVIENQILATAARQLLRLRSLPTVTRTRLRRLDHQLVDVQSIPSPARPPEVDFTRINERYRPAIGLARLILQASSLEEQIGGHRGVGFLVDMDKVFEDVVGHGLRKIIEPAGHRVGLQNSLPLDEAGRLTIRPDVLLRDDAGSVVAVADIKYKQPEAKAAAASDVYQAVVYAQTVRSRHCAPRLRRAAAPRPSPYR